MKEIVGIFFTSLRTRETHVNNGHIACTRTVPVIHTSGTRHPHAQEKDLSEFKWKSREKMTPFLNIAQMV